MSDPTRPFSHIMDHLAFKGWRSFSLEGAIESCPHCSFFIRKNFSSRYSVVDRLFEDINEKMIQAAYIDDLGSFHKRLVEFFHCYFEEFLAYEGILYDLFKSSMHDVRLGATMIQAIRQSLSWMLLECGYTNKGVEHMVFLHTLLATAGLLIHHWFSDETPDKSPSLALVDPYIGKALVALKLFDKKG